MRSGSISRAGDHGIQEGDWYDDRKRAEEQHACGRRRSARQNGSGSAVSSPAPQSAYDLASMQAPSSKTAAMLADAMYPIVSGSNMSFHQSATKIVDFAGRRGHVVRQLRPSLIGVDAGYRLKQN